jgi:hypothetical protein
MKMTEIDLEFTQGHRGALVDRASATDEPQDDDAVVVDGLSSMSIACGVLHERRLALGLDLDELIDRCACDPEAIEWADEGDVAAPVEALAYYAAAVGLRVEVRVTPA